MLTEVIFFLYKSSEFSKHKSIIFNTNMGFFDNIQEQAKKKAF